MAEWEITHPIDYSANGDNIGTFSQKVKYTLEQIFIALRELHETALQTGLTDSARAYEIRIDPETNGFYIRSGDNSEWICLGLLAENFGITPETISAIRNGGNLGKITCGSDANKPAFNNSRNDLYFATDTSTIYIWAGSAWNVFSSPYSGEGIKPDAFVRRTELTTAGGIANAGKILQLDSSGKAAVDITGSAASLGSNVAADFVFQSATTSIGGADYAGKVLKLDSSGKAAVDITGSAASLGSNVAADFVFQSATTSIGGADYAGKVLKLDSNGKAAVDITGSAATDNSSANHMKRLMESLQIALTIAGLDTTGHDSMFIGKFSADALPKNNIALGNVVMGSNWATLTDKNDMFHLIIGRRYVIVSGSNVGYIKISKLVASLDVCQVIFEDAIDFSPENNTAELRGYAHNGAQFFNKIINGVQVKKKVQRERLFCPPVSFMNKKTGETKNIGTVHLSVKHKNIGDFTLTARVSLLNSPKFVKGEFLSVGTGSRQYLTLAHKNNLQPYGFCLYFNGTAQEKSAFTLSPSEAEISFVAPAGAIVTADYYYDWGEENFAEMTKTGTYCDAKNNSQATTEFVYKASEDSLKGSMATLYLWAGQDYGVVKNEVLGTGTGGLQYFKLSHHASSDTIEISSSSAIWSLDDDTDLLAVTATSGEEISVSYAYLGEEFEIGYFAATFDE